MNEGPVMILAGEPSGDILAAELVTALAQSSSPSGAPSFEHFFGAGGPSMRQSGVEILHELTGMSVIGPVDVARRYFQFRKIFFDLLSAAEARRPSLVILVDFSHFNHRFAAAIRQRAHRTQGAWNPKIVKYVSPQVWASRPGRARSMERDLDLLLCLFPFEPAWYAARTPQLRVRYVGHPVLDRYPRAATQPPPERIRNQVVLLPGSREGELRRHWPVMVEMTQRIPHTQFLAVLPTQSLLDRARLQLPRDTSIRLQVGGLADALRQSRIAVASTGSVTMECAYFGIPTVALYKTSFLTYIIGKQLVSVRHLAMPNILAEREVMPEFVQGEATADNLSAAAQALLSDTERWSAMHEALLKITASLGAPGASQRAATFIQELMDESPPTSLHSPPHPPVGAVAKEAS